MGGDARRRRRHRAAPANPSPESPPPLESVDRRRRIGHEVAGNKPRVRQSVLYSDRPKQSQGKRGQVQSQNKSSLNEPTYDAGSKQGSSKIAEDKTRDDSDDV
ncbi:hypothetical protein OsI_08891 [Oryza sativa Indica Group]|uniref:Uncharacterized protein n=1 Tax=Oryza sativa subsp. indica TaxID=39946 RepID=A2X9H3_ORYSI|nr:hypothetical protein OsI_08891 [Oryza sativa Indica Group]